MSYSAINACVSATISYWWRWRCLFIEMPVARPKHQLFLCSWITHQRYLCGTTVTRTLLWEKLCGLDINSPRYDNVVSGIRFCDIFSCLWCRAWAKHHQFLAGRNGLFLWRAYCLWQIWLQLLRLICRLRFVPCLNKGSFPWTRSILSEFLNEHLSSCWQELLLLELTGIWWQWKIISIYWLLEFCNTNLNWLIFRLRSFISLSSRRNTRA